MNLRRTQCQNSFTPWTVISVFLSRFTEVFFWGKGAVLAGLLCLCPQPNSHTNNPYQTNFTLFLVWSSRGSSCTWMCICSNRRTTSPFTAAWMWLGLFWLLQGWVYKYSSFPFPSPRNLWVYQNIISRERDSILASQCQGFLLLLLFFFLYSFWSTLIVMSKGIWEEGEEYVCFVWHSEPEVNYTILNYYVCISICGLYNNFCMLFLIFEIILRVSYDLAWTSWVLGPSLIH